MGTRWLILDVNNLAWRAHHSTGGMTYDDMPTGVAYGFLRDLHNWMEEFDTQNVAFTFDHGPQRRVADFPYYKETRRKKRLDENAAAEYEAVSQQITKLRTDYLESLGFQNIFFQSGYEADDVIASVVGNLPEGDSAIIIGGDKDIYQLLRSHVDIYAPTQRMTMSKEKFKAKWFGLKPTEWPAVKAITGCSTDDVPGLDGVAEVSAAKFITNQLNQKLAKYKAISAFVRTQQYRDNLLLVSLPYAGCRDFELVEHTTDPDQWAALADRLGFASVPWATAVDRGFEPVRGRSG
jgi:5'-3' exonuclease